MEKISDLTKLIFATKAINTMFHHEETQCLFCDRVYCSKTGKILFSVPTFVKHPEVPTGVCHVCMEYFK